MQYIYVIYCIVNNKFQGVSAIPGRSNKLYVQIHEVEFCKIAHIELKSLCGHVVR